MPEQQTRQLIKAAICALDPGHQVAPRAPKLRCHSCALFGFPQSIEISLSREDAFCFHIEWLKIQVDTSTKGVEIGKPRKAEELIDSY